MARKSVRFQIDTKAWFADKELSRCQPATRGIWFDLLCCMHEDGATGVLEGTAAELARVSRCEADELVDALRDLVGKNAADIEHNDGHFTVTNRRMKAKAEKKKRVAGKPFTKPTEEEVAAYCEERKNEIDAGNFIAYYESNGWLIGGKSPMKDWKAAVRNWENRRKGKTGVKRSMPWDEAWGHARKVVHAWGSAVLDKDGWNKALADCPKDVREFCENTFGWKSLADGKPDTVRAQFRDAWSGR